MGLNKRGGWDSWTPHVLRGTVTLLPPVGMWTREPQGGEQLNSLASVLGGSCCHVHKHPRMAPWMPTSITGTQNPTGEIPFPF